MNAALTKPSEQGTLSLVAKLQQGPGSCGRKRLAELQALVAKLRSALDSAEAELERETNRPPRIGEFVRCPLTNFYGSVTRITPRPQGRPWVEILPYLANNLPGHATMDLYDSWELIDPPAEERGSPPAQATAQESPAKTTPVKETSGGNLPPQQFAKELELIMGSF